MYSYHTTKNSRIYILTTNKTKIEPTKIFDLFIEHSKKFENKADRTYEEEIIINEANILKATQNNYRLEPNKIREKNYEEPYLSLEINKLYFKNTNKETKLINYVINNPGSFEHELYKIKNENENINSECQIEIDKYCCEHFLKRIKDFSDSFITKWGPEKNKHNKIIEMTNDFLKLYKIICTDKINLIDPTVYSEYIEPIELLLTKIRDDNRIKIESLDIIKSYNISIGDFMALLDSNTINDPINSIGTTLLMFFYYLAAKISEPNQFLDPDSVSRIIEILLMYGADPSIKDINGLSCLDYKTKGVIIFG